MSAGRSPSVRVDKWLWAVRIFKTRTAASTACTNGRIRVNGEAAKPATKVQVGDRVEARRGERAFIVIVQEIIGKRVGAAIAVECYEDLSPPAPTRSRPDFTTPSGTRERGTGRPTKRDRRQIDRLRDRR